MQKRGRPVAGCLSEEPPQAQLNSYNYCQTGTRGRDRKRQPLFLNTCVPQHDGERRGRGGGGGVRGRGGGKRLGGSSLILFSVYVAMLIL